MLKKVVNFVDFNGKERSETLYFNLTEAEVVRIDVKFEGGLVKYIENLDEQARPEDILTLFETLIKASYGEKSEDGKHFLKTDEKADLFYQSAAYSALFVSLVQEVDSATAFFSGLLSQTAPPTPAS